MHYVFLALAIALELSGTTLLKYSDGFSKWLPTLGTIFSYVFCFYFLSKSLHQLSLSVAYATWSGVGIIASTLISLFIFKEPTNLLGISGVVLVVVGVVLLNLYGTSH